MLGRLMKYELKATARYFLPMYLVLMASAILGRFSLGNILNSQWYEVGDGILSGLMMLGYGLVIFAIIVVGFVVIIQRFYKNLTGEEGYLMHTLPVRTSNLILSKLLIAFFWEVISIMALVLSVLVLVLQPELLKEWPQFWQEFGSLLDGFISEMGIQGTVYLVLLIPAAIISVFSSTLVIYSAIAVGQLAKSHRILASVGAYIAITMVNGTISGSLSSALMMPADWSKNLPIESMGGLLTGSLALGITLELIFACAYFFLCNYILSSQLNLE